MKIVLMSDPRVAAIPVQDCGEELIDIRVSGLFLVDQRKQDPDGHFAHLRHGLIERLEHAQRLLPTEFRLLVVEGYRPPALQRAYFEEYATELRRGNPDWSDSRVHEAASRYVSPPEIAPHSAGAAVDLTLAASDGQEVDMGTRMNASPEESDGACYTHANSISGAARAHRDTLCRVMSAAGFVNYPTEWWHFSYGDRYWALHTGQAAAVYGPRDRT
ncbi:peptidase M15B and M15C DD-carboxypeptidase VanY/endolysin [Streptomyces sp. KO7888]|nr:peptidase M15B and M15C DD-carboxypeptidase VanY/endolysin [Streptomyces sp. KO7888]